MFSDEKEVSIVSTVLANNKIRLCELREQIIADQITFAVINTVCISRLSRILKKHISLKQLYRVPYERNSKYHLVCCHQCISVHHHSILSPYNTALIICFLETLHHTVVQDGPEQPQIVVMWGNVSTGLLWSETGSPTIIDLLHSTCHHTPNFWIQLSPHASSTSQGRGMRQHWGEIHIGLDTRCKAEIHVPSLTRPVC